MKREGGEVFWRENKGRVERLANDILIGPGPRQLRRSMWEEEKSHSLQMSLKHLSGIRFVYNMLIPRGREAQCVNIFRRLVNAEDTV